MVLYFHFDCIECQTNKHFPIKPKNVSPPLPFYENATYLTYRNYWTLKDSFLLRPRELATLSFLMLLVVLLSLTLLLTFPLNMLFKRYSTIEIAIFCHLKISSLIEVLNILIKMWPTFALSLVLTTLYVLHILCGQMVWTKSKTVTLELTCVYSYKILLLIGHSKLKCMLILTILRLFLNSNSPHIKMFFIHIPVFH